MLKKEDVEAWNNVFGDCPIKQSDLTKPTEGFLVRALVCYVRRFGYKVEPSFSLQADSVENSRDNRLFLIRLVRQIDHFLKITDKSYSFTYFDLIRPTPKKTTHTLYILLNYLFYYNMYKEEVVKLACEPIRKFQDVIAEIERTSRDNGLQAQETQNQQAEIEKMDHELSRMETESKDLSKQIESQEEEKKKLNDCRGKHELALKRLREMKTKLNRKMVSDDEILEIKKQIKYTQLECEKFKLDDCNSEEKLRELDANLNLHQSSIKETEKAAEIIPTRFLSQMSESNKQLEEAEKSLRDAEQRKLELMESIEKETNNLDNLSKEYQSTKEEFQMKLTAQTKIVYDLEIQSKEIDTKETTMQTERCNREWDLLNANDITQYIEGHITELLQTYEEEQSQRKSM